MRNTKFVYRRGMRGYALEEVCQLVGNQVVHFASGMQAINPNRSSGFASIILLESKCSGVVQDMRESVPRRVDQDCGLSMRGGEASGTFPQVYVPRFVRGLVSR